MKYEEELIRLIRKNDRMMKILKLVRAFDLPDWYIGVGVIRNMVWDHLHDFDQPTAVRDIDIVYFKEYDGCFELEQKVHNGLKSKMPDVDWDVKNQATVHLWYEKKFGFKVPLLISTYNAISTWPEFATCIGVRLNHDDEIKVCAPYGLEDLFTLKLRRNPKRVTQEIFIKRLREKKIKEKWPRVEVVI